MKALITGGSGFIGSHLHERLLKDGHDVVIVDKIYNYNVLDTTAMSNVFKVGRFDVVFHMAANSDISAGTVNSDIDLDDTFLTTYKVLKLMSYYNVRNLVFASSSAIYGEAKDELPENYGPLRPISHYGAAKLSAEAFISSFSASTGMRAWICRFANVVGSRMTHGVVLDFIKKLTNNPNELEVLGDGNQYKPYIHVDDLIDGMMFVWRNSSALLNTYNIGVRSRTRVKDIAKMVIEEMELNPEIKYTGGSRGWIGDVPNFSYDITKLSELGWTAKLESDGAIRKSIKETLRKE